MVNQRYINRKINSLSYLILYANVHKGHLSPDGATTKYCIAATAAAVRERGDDSDDGEAGDGVGGGAAGRQGGRLLVTAGCGNGGAAGLAVSFIILSFKEHKNMYNCKLQYSEITQVRKSLC